MNKSLGSTIPSDLFLNGVCRHEPDCPAASLPVTFLNGVCRHEQKYRVTGYDELFLNGVCRHEQTHRHVKVLWPISKWRMPP
ncbi:defensin-like peptide family protein [Acinetobacter baumannii 299505]|nr:defensin-like peptide family protein [Acinetobacter baumannii 299505]